MFTGCIVALVTPIRDGEVDYDNLKQLVEFHVAEGTDAIAPVGTTGESPTLSHDEHQRVIATVVEAAAGRVKVLASSRGCDQELLHRALKPNPAGNANERTPLVLVRPA